MLQTIIMSLIPDSPISQIPAGLVAALLLTYPLSLKIVHPVLQILICVCLTAVGTAQLLSFVTSDAWSAWCIAAVVVLSAANVILPVIGSIVGLGTAMGLLGYVVCENAFSDLVTHWVVGSCVVAGMSLLFVWRPMFIYWQLIAPPVVGGYLAAGALGGDYAAIVWAVLALSSIGLHARKFFAHSWLDKKKDIAVNGNESRITKAMRSANPNMTVDEFERLKIQLLDAVDGDTEQVDRVVYGGGLY